MWLLYDYYVISMWFRSLAYTMLIPLSGNGMVTGMRYKKWMWFRSFLYTVNPVNVKFGIYGKYGNYDSYIREVAQLKINNLTHKQYFLRTHPRTSPKSPQELVCKSILPENQHSIYNYAACRYCRFCRFQTVNSDKNDTLRTYLTFPK